MDAISLKDLAEVCRIGLEIGLFSRSDIVEWADRFITNNENSDYNIINISLNGNKSSLSDLERQLLDIKGDPDSELDYKIILGICSERYRLEKASIEDVSKILYQLLILSADLYQSAVGQKLLGLTDSIDLALSGIYGDIEKIKSDTKELLAQWSDFSEKFVHS